VPHDIDECDGAHPALGAIHPISRPRIFRKITVAAIPDVKAVERVIKDGQPDAEEFQPYYKGKSTQKLDLLGISAGAFGGECVRDEMLNEK
jgi:hypothetical protein